MADLLTGKGANTLSPVVIYRLNPNFVATACAEEDWAAEWTPFFEWLNVAVLKVVLSFSDRILRQLFLLLFQKVMVPAFTP
jgi:hypothetical protein